MNLVTETCGELTYYSFNLNGNEICMKKVIVDFGWDCGRMGSVSSTFVCNEDDLNNAIGSDIYFGEILGKHSEVYGTLNQEDVKIVSDDQDFIIKFEKVIGENWSSGYNPLHYINDEK